MGAIGGSILHFIRGARNSPSGARFAGAIDAVKVRAPMIGGSFAVWGGLFSTFDCSLQAVRHKEDPWNSIMAGAMTGGVLASRSGMRAASKSAAIGGILLAVIEGVSIVITRYSSTQAMTPEDVKRMREEMERTKGGAPTSSGGDSALAAEALSPAGHGV